MASKTKTKLSAASLLGRKEAKASELSTVAAVAVDDELTPATISPRALIPCTELLPAWCRVAEAQLRARPSVLPSEDQIVVLQEAAQIAPKRRAMVTLPSGKILECTSSVLVLYCSALVHRSRQLLTTVVELQYGPRSNLWSDEEVLAFFSMLHQDSRKDKVLEQSSVEPAWMALSKALGVQRYIDFCLQTIRSTLLWQVDTQPQAAWKWMEAYRQHVSPAEWQRDCLEFLMRLNPANFKPYVQRDHRGQLHAMFANHDLLALVYSRWKQWGQGQHGPNSLVNKRIRVLWGSGTWREGTVTQYNGQHCVKYDGAPDAVWCELTTVISEVDGHRVQLVNQSTAPSPDRCRLDRPPLPSRTRPKAGEPEPSAGREVTTFEDAKLPNCMLLRIVIGEHLCIICNYDVIEAMSPVVGEAVIDESSGIATLHMPLATSFDRDDVVQFFNLAHKRQAPPTTWRLSWVHLADHLQMEEWLGPMATWLWNNVLFDQFADWVVATRLQSMQQRKPENIPATLTDQDVLQRLVSMTPQQLTAALLSTDAYRLVSIFGTEMLLDVLDKRNF